MQKFVLETITPLNQAVGDAWMHGDLQVFEEHLYTEQLQVVLRTAINARNVASSGSSLLVRIGLNAGEPVEEDHDVFGASVNLAARVCGAGRADEVLLTRAVRDLSAGHGFAVESRGCHDLKGFPDPVELYALVT